MCAAEPVGRLSPIEDRVRQYLVARAKKADRRRPSEAKITYSGLCSAIDPDQHYWARPRFRGIGQTLGRICTFEHEQGRPLLSALVVRATDQQPGPGFADLARNLGYQIQPGQERAFGRSQLEEV